MNGGRTRQVVSEINGWMCILYRALWATVRTLVLIIRTCIKSAFPFNCSSAKVSLELRGGQRWEKVFDSSVSSN